MSGFSFSKVSIIQSLEESEFHSGTELQGYLAGLREDNPASPQVELTEVENVAEFLEVIERLVSGTRADGHWPILHLELHGWEDKTGLAFPDDSSLSWHELAEALARLNLATEFNLMVCVGTCFGAHFLGALRPLQASPCVALFGPTHLTDGAELFGVFRGFYRVLFATGSAEDAYAVAQQVRLDHGSFLMQDAEFWFCRLALGYLEEKCTRAMLFERAAKGIAEVERATGKTLAFGLAVKIQIDQAMVFLDRAFAAYFMTADIPENNARFADSLAAAKARADKFFEAEKLDLH